MLAATATATAAAAQAALPAGEAAGFAPVILDVRINGQPQEALRPALRHAARLLFERAQLEAWQLVLPARAAASVDGLDYFDPSDVPGVRLTLDEATQTVRFDVPPEGFRSSFARGRTTPRPALSPAVFGVFANYDLAVQRDRFGTRASGLVDVAASGGWGLAAGSFVIGQPFAAGGESGLTRLDSYLRFDDPDRQTRWTVGDAVSRSAAWSVPFRFGGVQFGTRFDLVPGYVSYPTPSVHGGAALPSAVEVYVNDTLRFQGRADAGPFAVNDVPVLTGAGEMRLSVTDALGVQRTVTAPYYVSTQLLRPGLSDFSLEAGWTRLGYGTRSFDYGRPFAAGTWRRGLALGATVELHAEAGARSRTAGAGLSWAWAPVGEFSLHGAASGAPAGNGRLGRAAFLRTSGDWSFAASRQVASRGFTQVAWQDESPTHVVAQSQLFGGRSLGRYGSLGASYTRLRYDGGDRIAVASAHWTIAIGSRASLAAYVARTRQNSGHGVNSVGFTLTLPLGERQTAALSLQRVDGRGQAIAEAVRTPGTDIDGDFGWRVLAGGGERPRGQAGVDLLGRHGVFSAEAAAVDGDTAVRLRAAGAVGYAGGVAFAARPSDDAFALVTVPGSPGLRIYRENQHLATTDAQGRAIVPGLRAYEANRIEIDSGDLPIDARIGADALQVVPRSKGVADAVFDVSRGTTANLVVRLPDGSPLPPGVDVYRAAGGEPLLSGFGGAVSIDDPAPGERFEARWRGGRCTFEIGPGPGAVCRPSLAATP